MRTLCSSSAVPAYAALLHATPLDIRLVVVGSKPVYGDRDLMEKLLLQAILDSVETYGMANVKVLYLGPDASLGGFSISPAPN